MTQQNDLYRREMHFASVAKSMLLGAGIALILISSFLLAAGATRPAWGSLWMMKPLLMVPAAGAIGGLFYHFMEGLHFQAGWKTALAIVASLIGYIIILWLRMVLGLNGNWWD